jgi:small redox-active disulfide protein 2
VWSAPRNYWALKSLPSGGKKMKKIQILGTGCAKCMKLTANAEEAAKQVGIEFEIEKVADINKIMNYGVMMTPALAIDGQVKSVGKVLFPEEIKKLL